MAPVLRLGKSEWEDTKPKDGGSLDEMAAGRGRARETDRCRRGDPWQVGRRGPGREVELGGAGAGSR